MSKYDGSDVEVVDDDDMVDGAATDDSDGMASHDSYADYDVDDDASDEGFFKRKVSAAREYVLSVVRMYSPIELVVQFVGVFALSAWFYHFITGSVKVSIGIGIVSALFFFHVFSYKSRKLRLYQENLNNLMKYVTNVTIFLQMGENEYHALMLSKVTLNKDIQDCVQQTIDILDEDAVLVTKHFERFDFPSINQFHQNLAVKYNSGGNPRELFGSIQTNMMNELKKRDELYTKRKSFAVNVYTMLGMVVIMLVILRVMVTGMWDIFMSYSFASHGVLIATYFAVFLNLRMLQKKVIDIQVQV